MNTSYEKTYEKSRILINGVLTNNDIKQRIAAVYTEERLAVGNDLLAKAKQSMLAQDKEKIESSMATSAYHEVDDRLHSHLVKARRAVRYFFKNDEMVLAVMHIEDPIPSDYNGWKAMCEHVMNGIILYPVVQEKLNLVGITDVVVDKCKSDLQKLDLLKSEATKESGDAQVATVAKKEAFNNLKEYCNDLRECLDLFYDSDDRQQLEKVGVVVH
nr:hypothetical protein [uncultured Carboxylicivirga sp.]